MKHSKKNIRRRTVSRQYNIETLERRELLDGAGTLLSESPDLTLSFAADGVDVGGKQNQLNSFMESQFSDANWKETILRAFQTWAVNTNANLGVVDEEGTHAFGAEGSRLRDPRFGDIRIGARPLADNVLAISIPQDTLVSGTWSGDVIFNSNGTYDSIHELFSVAVHEAGHVFGLSHSDDENSPMNFHGVSEATTLTDADIFSLQSLYGARSHDNFDQKSRNESLASASNLDLTKIANLGSAPSIAFADLGLDDIDYYNVELPNSYNGPITVRLRSSGTSLLAPALNIYNGNGEVISQLQSNSSSGDLLFAELTGNDYNNDLFVEVTSAADDVFAVGGYSLAVVFNEINQVDVSVVEQLTGELFAALDDDDVDSFFQDDDDLFNDDDHSDDVFESAQEIGEFDESDELRRFQIVASLAELTDVDYFEVESPETMAEKGTMIASVRPLETGGSVPSLDFFDEDGRPVATEILVNDGREILVQANDVAPDSELFLRVAPTDNGQNFQFGNYELTVLFQKQPVVLSLVAEHTLTAGSPTSSHLLEVDVPQLQHFSLLADGPPNEAVKIVVRDSDGTPVRQISTPNGTTTTSQSVLLMPGTYTIDASLESGVGNSNFQVKATAISIPIGLVPVNPSDLDFSCPDIDNTFCYPGGIQSVEPFLWEDFLIDFPADPHLTPTEQVDALLGEWWGWYWNRIPGNNPPLTISDSFEINNGRRLSVDSSQGVIANDIEPNGDILSAVVSRQPTNGVLELSSNGGFSYTPNPGFIGSDSFSYLVSDSALESNSAVVTIEVLTPLAEGDFNGDGIVTAADVNLLTTGISSTSDVRFDVNQDGTVDPNDRKHMIEVTLGSVFGDSNLDGKFDSSDLVFVFQQAKYETPNAIDVGWEDGDWNGDGKFTSADLVLAMQAGNYIRT